MNLVAALDRAARATPGKPFLRHDGATITYAQARDRSHRAAAVLSALGVAAGDRVAAMCFNTPAFVDLLLGAWRLGAAFVPVNHKLQAAEIDYVLAHSGSKAILFDALLAPVLERVAHPAQRLVTEGAPAGLPCFDTMLAAADGVAGIEPADGDLAQILYTSGTTGRPKGCMHSHRTVTLAAMQAALALSITRDERTLMAMPIWHSSPLNNWFGGTLIAGGTVVLLREYHPLRFLQTVERERVTLYFGAPVSYTLPLDQVEGFAAFDLTSVRAWIYGGGPIGAAQAERLAHAYRGGAFFQVYGMTETGPAGTSLYPDEQVAKAGSIGHHGGPGVDLRVVRMDGADARPGETGEIWLKTDSMMLGYLDDPAATRAAFAPNGWYRTGDVARIDQDGYLFLVDRLKDMIVTGGENVYSKEVEDVLVAHPDVIDAAVVGIPHPEWGETVVAHVVVRAGAARDEHTLRAFCAERLAAYKVPREVVFADALPRTPTGKLQKFLLRRRDG
ncbi:class I adenylate-forming enzyme family protein [Burkholderia ubonensis]|uniref:class I adenylate-forming enzyme family protein n=1 Tax=Burkholderia ubonensis TaxID=101571 RepID=UPI000752F65D|nr:AMP-binding protein [Burkholderia ubonensis]AOI69026.1 fatty-acid--CoA ligase [Burkholderia ubonensis]KUZ19641.1 fatty-acid--CoA ligase [Burkholderia ubonensis]KUZ30437.1 fatty-acid--CoA ligase [Burkholderia ubonensis]KUZ38553.1 fatty-acid--CoA ligase [Burkholderia ubonensis]KUZ42836.1 fatty-acid--CoA ligase [Burkholderia ubonensis]